MLGVYDEALSAGGIDRGRERGRMITGGVLRLKAFFIKSPQSQSQIGGHLHFLFFCYVEFVRFIFCGSKFLKRDMGYGKVLQRAFAFGS